MFCQLFRRYDRSVFHLRTTDLYLISAPSTRKRLVAYLMFLVQKEIQFRDILMQILICIVQYPEKLKKELNIYHRYISWAALIRLSQNIFLYAMCIKLPTKYSQYMPLIPCTCTSVAYNKQMYVYIYFLKSKWIKINDYISLISIYFYTYIQISICLCIIIS